MKTVPKEKIQSKINDTEEVEPSRHSLWFAAAFVVAFFVLIASAYLAHKQIMRGWETIIFRHINNLPDSLQLLGRITSIAKESTWIAVVAVAVVFMLRKWRLAWRLSASIIAGYVVTFGFKHFIHRPRPAQLLSDVHLRWNDTGAGFPSGHVMVVTVILLTLMPFMPKIWRWIIAGGGIGLVAWSRIYLGLHAPLDVIGGFVIGVGVVTFLYILPRKISNFFHFS